MGKWTRRAVIGAGVLGSGALILGVAVRPGHRAPKLQALVGEGDETVVTAWVKIAPDNQITAIIPHSEMGQGVQTSLGAMLADELDADWSTVKTMEAPAHEEYANYSLAKGFFLGSKIASIPKILVGTVDGAFMALTRSMDLQITGGSTSVRATGVYGMRVAGAAARAILLEAASNEWNVPVAELTAENSHVIHTKSDRREPFATFAAAAAEIKPSLTPKLKKPSEFKIMGKSVPRVDIPAKVDGTAKFGIDAEMPGMKYAAIKQAPVFGGSVVNADEAAGQNMPGVIKVINLTNAVAVVADGYWQAKQALDRMNIEFDTAEYGEVDDATLYAQAVEAMERATAEGEEEIDFESGDAAAAVVAAETVVEAEYQVPLLAHATMEPMNCTAWVHDGICEVITGSQNPLGVRGAVAEALEMDDADVSVQNMNLGGGFGRRATPDFAVQAALIAGQVDFPVKLIWSREEDMQHDIYRPAVVSRFVGGLNAEGQPIAWVNQFVHKSEPPAAPHIPYAIDNQRIHFTNPEVHVPFGPWRSVDHSQHGYFTESFIDELAHAAKADPYEFRRRLLEGAPRHQAVLDMAARKANWGKVMPTGSGRGIALQASFGSIVAQVFDVEVRDGKVHVPRVVCAVDPGFAVNPDGLIAQMESGIIYGLTAALYGEISIADGAVKQSNFHDYEMVRMDEAPKIETHIINSGESWGGAGEPGTPAVAAALANGIFAATGFRVRQLPIKNFDLTYGRVGTENIG